MKKKYGKIKRKYLQKSVRDRIKRFFLDNVGRIVTREQIIEVARNPETGKAPENWHQRLSELRTDRGYTILSWRNRGDLRISEYLMPTAERRPAAAPRVKIIPTAWQTVLDRAAYACEWTDGGIRCGLKPGESDPVGGGTVRLTPDHKTPHAVNPNADPSDPGKWQALCGRHQVMKKNYWNDETGWLNVYAIVQSASEGEKREVYEFLKKYFGDA